MNRGSAALLSVDDMAAIAKKYVKLSDFRLRQPSVYNRAKNLGVILKITSHMERGVFKNTTRAPVIDSLNSILDGTCGRTMMYKTLSLVPDIQTGAKLIPQPFGTCWLQEYWKRANYDKT